MFRGPVSGRVRIEHVRGGAMLRSWTEVDCTRGLLYVTCIM